MPARTGVLGYQTDSKSATSTTDHTTADTVAALQIQRGARSMARSIDMTSLTSLGFGN
jgi:hypothetical protein